MFSDERGITLIEIIVVMVIATMFSMILVTDFPKILRQFAISRTAYRLAQDIRKTEDLGLSGVRIGDGQIAAKGYGVYITSLAPDNKKYIIYADRGDTPNQQFDSTDKSCDQETNLQLDCIVESIDITKQEYDIYIEKINGDVNNWDWASINFKPPNPDIKLVTSNPETESKIDIVLTSASDSSLTRTVSVNKSGLVEVK